MDSAQQQIRSFVLETFRRTGVSVREVSAGLFQILLPPAMHRWFANRTEMTVTFDPTVRLDHPEAELVTPGASFLQRLTDFIRHRTDTAEAYLTPAVPHEYELTQAFPITGVNCTITAIKAETCYRPLLQGTVRAELTNDEKWVLTCPVCVDMETGTLLPEPLPLTERQHAVLPGFKKPTLSKASLQAAYRRVLEGAQSRIQEQVAAQEIEAEIRLRREIDQLNQFYPGADDAAERTRKQEQLRSKYALTVSYELGSAVVLWRPEVCWQAKAVPVGHRTGGLPVSASRELLTGQVALPACSGCGMGTARVHHCTSGPHLVCDLCSQACSRCGHEQCYEHPLERCVACGAGLCDGCTLPCPSCGAATCPEHRVTCQVGTNHWTCPQCSPACPTCGRLACTSHSAACHVDGKRHCRECMTACDACRKLTCRTHTLRCTDPACGRTVCADCVSACAHCGKVLCMTHLTACATCGQMVCSEHGGHCSVGGETQCTKHIEACRSCGRPHCSGHAGTCKLCGEMYCRTCLGTGQTCPACQTLTRLPPGNPIVRHLRSSLPFLLRLLPGIWFSGEHRTFRVVVARSLAGYRLWIVDRQTGRVIKALAFGHEREPDFRHLP